MGIRKTFFVVAGSLALVAIGAVVAKLHSRYKLQTFFASQRCDDVPCLHRSVRLMAIESVISQLDGVPSYLMIGDSITELADLPEICGRKPINAGIGWASTRTFANEGKKLAELANPDFIVVALGTNDALLGLANGFRSRLDELLKSLGSSKVIVVPLPPSPYRMPSGSTRTLPHCPFRWPRN